MNTNDRLQNLRLDAALELSPEGPSIAPQGSTSLIADVEVPVTAENSLHAWGDILGLHGASQTPPASTGGDWEFISPSAKHSACGSSSRSLHGSECEGASEVNPDDRDAFLGELDQAQQPSPADATTVVLPPAPPMSAGAADEAAVEVAQPEMPDMVKEDIVEGAAAVPKGLTANMAPDVSSHVTVDEVAQDVTHVGLTWVMSWFTGSADMDAGLEKAGAGIQSYLQAWVSQVRPYLKPYVPRDWPRLGLGAGVLLLGTMLASSYLHNRRLASTLRSRDREVAKLVMKILSMQDTLQARRFPIVRHTAWASLPAELM